MAHSKREPKPSTVINEFEAFRRHLLCDGGQDALSAHCEAGRLFEWGMHFGGATVVAGQRRCRVQWYFWEGTITGLTVVTGSFKSADSTWVALFCR